MLAAIFPSSSEKFIQLLIHSFTLFATCRSISINFKSSVEMRFSVFTTFCILNRNREREVKDQEEIKLLLIQFSCLFCSDLIEYLQIIIFIITFGTTWQENHIERSKMRWKVVKITEMNNKMNSWGHNINYVENFFESIYWIFTSYLKCASINFLINFPPIDIVK